MEHLGNPVIESIRRSEALPDALSASSAFESVMGALVQRLPAKHAIEFVERHLPGELRALLQRDAEEALEEGVKDELADYLHEVSGLLNLEPPEARELVDAVIGSLRLLLSAQEVEAFAKQLSPQLASMWIEACRVPGASTRFGEP